jgi:hypothetical protein
MSWSMSGHDRRHWKAPSSTDHYLRAISRVWLDWRWWEHGRQNGTLRVLVGSPILFFLDVTLRPWFEGQKEERRFVCTVSRFLSGHCYVRSLVRSDVSECAGDYATVDHLIWHCERFWLERHRLIDALAALNVSIGIPFRDLFALKKWCAMKCCLDFLEIKLLWFDPFPIFEGLEMYSLGPWMASISGLIRFYFFVKIKKIKENWSIMRKDSHKTLFTQKFSKVHKGVQ